MTDYDKLVKALRFETDYVAVEKTMRDAADAIEKLITLYEKAEIDATNLTGKLTQAEAQLPKRGKWELIDGAEPMRWGCSRCKYLSWDTPNYCPRCGAKMEVKE